MILRVAIRVLRGGDADDVRSDDEADEELDIEVEKFDPSYQVVNDVEPEPEPQPYEEEVGVEAINLKGRTSNASRYKKSVSSSSGVSLPGHSDRKELLGRIGCDKGVWVGALGLEFSGMTGSGGREWESAAHDTYKKVSGLLYTLHTPFCP